MPSLIARMRKRTTRSAPPLNSLNYDRPFFSPYEVIVQLLLSCVCSAIAVPAVPEVVVVPKTRRTVTATEVAASGQIGTAEASRDRVIGSVIRTGVDAVHRSVRADHIPRTIRIYVALV